MKPACWKIEAGRRNLFRDGPGDVERIARYPLTLFGSDGLPFDPRPHPRQWGTFPHIGKDGARVRLDDAGTGHPQDDRPGRATIRPAGPRSHRNRLPRRHGPVRPGPHPDRATFEDPIQVSEGIEGVWLNGSQTWDGHQTLPARTGQVLRRETSPSEQRGRQGQLQESVGNRKQTATEQVPQIGMSRIGSAGPHALRKRAALRGWVTLDSDDLLHLRRGGWRGSPGPVLAAVDGWSGAATPWQPRRRAS